MDDKAFARFDVLHRGVCFGQIERDHIAVNHRAPRRVHDVDAAVIVERRDEKHRHRENCFCRFDLLFHCAIPLLFLWEAQDY